MASSARFETARIRLARVTVSTDRPFRMALHEVAVIAADTLDVRRISVWRLMDDRQAIRCHFLYQPGSPDVTDGAILQREHFPLYFSAVELRRVVRVNDVREDPLSGEFRERYFEPLGITAMLDAPIYRAGVVDAIVCHEHLGSPRVWTDAETEFAGTVAETMARLYGELMLTTARDALGMYRRQVEQLRHLSGLGRLAAGMAHDFGNILLVAHGNAELIAGQPGLDDTTRQLARDVLSATARGQALVESLMRLGRPSIPAPRVVDVSRLLGDLEPVLRMAAGSRVALTVEPGSGLSRVMVEPNDLERALVNLAVNARDAMPEGGRLWCRAVSMAPRREHGGAPYVVIEMQDEGHGMDDATVARVFEPFFTTKGDAGVGLGLALVQQMVVMAGGFTDVSSRPGAGTTFRLCFPAIAPPADTTVG